MKFLFKTYQIIACLDFEAKRKIVIAQVIIFISSLTETASLLLVAPIIATLAGNYGVASKIVNYFDSRHSIVMEINDVLSFFALSYVFLTIISSLIGMLSIRVLSRYVSFVAKNASVRLLKKQLTSDYLDFCKYPHSHYINFDLNEVSRFADNVLQPIAQINSRMVSGILISLLLLLMNPFVAILSSIIFAFSYFLMYKLVRGGLKDNGEIISKESNLRTSLIKDSLRSIKEVIIYKIDDFFVGRFDTSTSNFYSAYANLNVLYNVPRYVIELLIYVAFGVFIYLVSAGFILLNGDHVSYLVVFGLAAIKLLPIFQQTYSSVARIKGSADVVDKLYNEIVVNNSAFKKSVIKSKYNNLEHQSVFSFLSIAIDNVSYRYPNSNVNVIDDLSYTFPRTGRVAIVGPSGSGKSTLVDMIVGLLAPTSGSIETRISDCNGNQSNSMDFLEIGYVPQDPILVQGSILDNITLQFDEDDSVVRRAMKSLNEVGLSDFVQKLPNGIFSGLSSDNFGISGGQRQRIAIARALYRRTPILVLDEPTSALDSESERTIIELLRKISENILVITIAHRLNTIVDYDDLIFLKDGKLVASGTYNFLFKNNVSFQDFVTSGCKNTR